MSPLLFATFINDLENCLNTEQCNGINIDDSILTDFLKILILLYADDTVIFAENINDMQMSSNVFHDYCIRWKLTVNMTKTKVVVFGSKGRRHPIFYLFDNILEVTDCYKYLGLCFSKNCTYSLTKKCIKEQATKAMFLLKSRISNLNLPIDCQLKPFDQTILPILLYGCEIWGLENCSIIESVFHFIVLLYYICITIVLYCTYGVFWRSILGVKRSTPLYMIYGELGRFPLVLYVKSRMINYWCRMLNNDNKNKLSFRIYNVLLSDYVYGTHAYKWFNFVENIFNETGFTYVWLS